MPKIISNEIERKEEETLGENEIIERVEPVKRKRVLSEEQRAKQAENLKKGREALQAKREAVIKERAQMLHDSVVEAAPKPKKEDQKLKRILEAVGSIAAEKEEEPEEEVIVVKKRAPKKKTIIIEQEEEEEQQQPPPPPAVTPKPKRQYRKREPKVDFPKAEPSPVVTPIKQGPSLVFY